MERLNPIFTKQRECHDCHKCIRECPVKAIRVQDTYARIMPEVCILCGNCVQMCPGNAKQVRDDLPMAKALMASGRRVAASLAPSFAAQYADLRPGQLIAAMKQLGFDLISETALGAQQVSAAVHAQMSRTQKQMLISSACPVVVDLIAKYYPDCQPYISQVLSPLLTHCKMLRAQYGQEIGIIFIGPCIAKKKEAADHPELLDVALTFEDLDHWLEECGIHPAGMEEGATDRFEPHTAQEGALYPIDGGMAPGLTGGYDLNNLEFLSFSGMNTVVQVLRDIPAWSPDHNLFFELTACAGSCINGPKARSRSSLARRRYDVLHYAQPADVLPRRVEIDAASPYDAAPVVQAEYSDLQVREALRTIGKHSVADELDCGGCGYESCREFGRALIAGNAERMMCATYTRKLAQKKAHALLQRMPSALVIVDENLRILECNASFVRLFASDGEQPSDLEGRAVSTVVPFSHLFRRVIDSGEEIVGHDIRFLRKILNTSIFAIESQSVIGGIFRDITEPIVQKEQVVARARQVIEKNLKTVQQIAYLLGENAADSEIILNSIVSSFSPEEPEAEGEESFGV
jgi:iron only hydrogenase large subunit-like protein